ncbi:MAG: ABA4-like family protein [Anaerolineales bacterium]
METVYTLINLYVLPFWIMMILMPRWSWTKRVMQGVWPVAVLPVIYAVLLVSQGFSSSGLPLDFSLNGIAGLLGTPAGAAIGWAHFLAFDLFVGRWVYLDHQERKLSAWVVSPILFFVFMAGPLGLLLYLIARRFQK